MICGLIVFFQLFLSGLERWMFVLCLQWNQDLSVKQLYRNGLLTVLMVSASLMYMAVAEGQQIYLIQRQIA